MDQVPQESNISEQPFVAQATTSKKSSLFKVLYIIPLFIGFLLFGLLGILLINNPNNTSLTVPRVGKNTLLSQTDSLSPTPNLNTKLFQPTFKISPSASQPIAPTATSSNVATTSSLLTDLVSYWKIDESTSSSTMTDSHGANNGNPAGTAIIWGLLGKARSFNGQSDVVTIPTNITLNPIEKSFSWSSWFQIDTLYSTASAFLAKNDYQSFQGFVMQYSGNGDLKATIFQPSLQINVESPLSTVTTKVWNHVMSTWDASIKTFKLFVNGSLVAVATSSASVSLNPSSDLVLGKGTIGIKNATGSATAVTTSFRGNIDEVGFWTRALTEADIAALYNKGKGKKLEEFATSSATPTPTVATSSAVQGVATGPSLWKRILTFFRFW